MPQSMKLPKLTDEQRKVAEQYVPLAKSITNNWIRRNISTARVYGIEDLHQTVYIALCRAVAKFEERAVEDDPTRNVKLCTLIYVSCENKLVEAAKHVYRKKRDPRHWTVSSDVISGIMAFNTESQREIDQNESKEEVDRLLLDLHGADRETALLLMEGNGVKTIARKFCVSRWAVNACIRKMRRLIEK